MLNKEFNNRQSKSYGNNNQGGPSNQRGKQGSRQQGENSGIKKYECYECHGKGHYAWECATKLNKLRKANQTNRSMNATLSDDENDSQSHEEQQFTAIVTSLEQQSIHSISKEAQLSECSLSHESIDASDDENEEELNLRIPYD
ncbi:hypothetical protein LguiA_016828 [Lonicera macranthoides]